MSMYVMNILEAVFDGFGSETGLRPIHHEVFYGERNGEMILSNFLAQRGVKVVSRQPSGISDFDLELDNGDVWLFSVSYVPVHKR